MVNVSPLANYLLRQTPAAKPLTLDVVSQPQQLSLPTGGTVQGNAPPGLVRLATGFGEMVLSGQVNLPAGTRVRIDSQPGSAQQVRLAVLAAANPPGVEQAAATTGQPRGSAPAPGPAPALTGNAANQAVNAAVREPATAPAPPTLTQTGQAAMPPAALYGALSVVRATLDNGPAQLSAVHKAQRRSAREAVADEDRLVPQVDQPPAGSGVNGTASAPPAPDQQAIERASALFAAAHREGEAEAAAKADAAALDELSAVPLDAAFGLHLLDALLQRPGTTLAPTVQLAVHDGAARHGLRLESPATSAGAATHDGRSFRMTLHLDAFGPVVIDGVIEAPTVRARLALDDTALDQAAKAELRELWHEVLAAFGLAGTLRVEPAHAVARHIDTRA